MSAVAPQFPLSTLLLFLLLPTLLLMLPTTLPLFLAATLLLLLHGLREKHAPQPVATDISFPIEL